MVTDIEYALMAGWVYQSTRGKINWFADGTTWDQAKLINLAMTGAEGD
jgi:hypothetical protein